MKVLLVDRDRMTTQLLQSHLEAEGHQVVAEQVRKDALATVERDNFDIVMIDPAPLPSARQMVLPLRWEQRNGYFYIISMSHEADPVEIVRCGLNDYILKPFDWADVAAKLANAARMNNFMRRLCDTEEIQSDTHVFGKRGFYQLVLSALDRAHRYAESGYLMVFRIANIGSVVSQAGAGNAQKMIADTADFLARLHRRSDFLGHTDTAEYALLLLRPAIDTEATDAVERFTIALRDFQADYAGLVKPRYAIELWALPSAAVTARVEI
jgi:PleD family two-component response regulator